MDSKAVAFSLIEDDLENQNCCSPKTASFRYFGLLLMCLLGFGSYFCYDNPGALQDKLETDLNMPASDFIILYSIYSWPNVILCFIGGFLLDRVFGTRWGTIIYIAISLCGQLLFAMGAYLNTFWLMVLGRFIFGSGADSVAVAQNNYAVNWFKGKSLNTLFGLQLSFSKVGSTANSLSLEYIYRVASEKWHFTGSELIGVVFYIAALTIVGSIICALLLGYMDSRAEKIWEKDKDKKPELVKLTDVKNFKITYWLIVWICVTYYIAVWPFVSLGKLFFMKKYGYGPDEANTVISLVYSVSAIVSPLLGILVDKTGRNIIWVLASIIGTLMTHGFIAFTYFSPHACMVFLGLFSSMFGTSLWTMIAYVIPENQLGTAFGAAQALLNLSLAVSSIVCGMIVEKHGYFWLEIFFLAWLLLSLIPAVIIWRSGSEPKRKT